MVIRGGGETKLNLKIFGGFKIVCFNFAVTYRAGSIYWSGSGAVCCFERRRVFYLLCDGGDVFGA